MLSSGVNIVLSEVLAMNSIVNMTFHLVDELAVVKFILFRLVIN